MASTVVGSASYRTSVWGLQELFLTVYLWAYSVLLVMTLPSLLYKSIHALPPGSTIRRTTSANHTSLHEYWRGLCPFHRFYAWCTRRQRSSTSSAPPPPLGDGLAPTGRVRVVIAHEVQEDYLHDVNLSTDDRIVLHETKTTIRGGRDPINAVPPSIAVLHIDDSGRTVEVGGNGVLPDVGWTRPDWAMGQRGEEGLQSPAEEVRRGSSTSALPRISSLTGGVRWDWRLGPRKGLV